MRLSDLENQTENQAEPKILRLSDLIDLETQTEPKTLRLSDLSDGQKRRNKLKPKISEPDFFEDSDEFRLAKSQVEKKQGGRGFKKIVSDPSEIKEQMRINKIKSENPDLAKLAEHPASTLKIAGLDTGIELGDTATKTLIGIGRGFNTLGRGLGLSDNTQSNADDILLHDSAAARAGKMIGETAPFLIPGAAASKIPSAAGRLIGAGATTGAETGIISRGSGDDDEEAMGKAIVGVLGGAVGEMAIPLFSRVSGKLLKSKRNELTASKSSSDDLGAALAESDINMDEYLEGLRDGFKGGDPELNKMRQEAFDELGIIPTEAERTRNADLFTTQTDLVKQDTPVRDFAVARNSDLQNKTLDVIRKTQGVPERASESIFKAIENKSIKIDDKIKELYTKAREIAPTEKVIKYDKAVIELRKNAPSNDVADNVVSVLKNKMKSMGVIDDNFKPVGRVDLGKNEELRQFANRISQSVNKEGQYILSQFKSALDDDALDGISKLPNASDEFKAARKAKFDFENASDPNKINKFDKRKISLVRDIRENKMSRDDYAEIITKRTSKYKASDLVELKKYLTTGDEDDIQAGLAAWDDLRSHALNEIKESAFKGVLNETNRSQLSAAGLESAVKKIGPDKMKVLFSSDEMKFLGSLLKVAKYTTPPTNPIGSGPSGLAIQQLKQATENKLGIVGGLVQDVMSSIKKNANVKQVLRLVDDAKVLEKSMIEEKSKMIRNSRVGDAISTAPIAIIGANANAEEGPE